MNRAIAVFSAPWIARVGGAGLLVLALGYWLTYEPAPAVRVLWREGLTPQQREVLERKYLLKNRRDQFPNGSTAYDLVDTSVRNVRALVHDPAVADTGDIDRDLFTIPFDTEYGQSWMWVANRIPVIRQDWVRRTATVVLVVMTVAGISSRWRRRKENRHG